MPFKLFSEQKRTVNTSVFGFTKTAHSENDEVVFYNLEDDGLVSVQHKGRIDKFNKWTEYKNDILDCVLNSKEGVNCEKRKIFKNGILNCSGIRDHGGTNSSMVKISDLFDIVSGTLASENAEEGAYDFITGSEDWKKHTEYTHDTEAIVYVVAAAGSLGRSHYVNGKFCASNLCLILTPKKESKRPVNLQFYNAYLNNLRKRIVSDLADGTSKLTINHTLLKDYFIEYVSIEDQNSFVESYLSEYFNNLKKLKNIIYESEEKIKLAFNDIL